MSLQPGLLSHTRYQTRRKNVSDEQLQAMIADLRRQGIAGDISAGLGMGTQELGNGSSAMSMQVPLVAVKTQLDNLKAETDITRGVSVTVRAHSLAQTFF